MITAEEAYAQTDPNATEEQRVKAAENIIAGVAANDAYWNSRSELEALRAAHEGHGVVTRDGSADTPPAASVPAAEKPETIDSTAEEVSEGDQLTEKATPASDAEAAAKLRDQLKAAGITPDA